MITRLDAFFSISVLQQVIQSQQTQTEIVYFFCHPLSTEINRTDHRSVCLGDNTRTVQPLISPTTPGHQPAEGSEPAGPRCVPTDIHMHLKRDWFLSGHIPAPPKGSTWRQPSWPLRSWSPGRMAPAPGWPTHTSVLAPREELKGIWTPHEHRHFASQLGKLHSEAGTKVGWPDQPPQKRGHLRMWALCY